jgi:hypothetical protein
MLGKLAAGKAGANAAGTARGRRDCFEADMIRPTLILAVSALVTGANALAGTISVSPIGGGIILNSGDFTSTVFGTAKPAWGPGSLASVHNALNDAGIDTDGKVTFVPADTSRGLALLVLIDREVAAPPPAATGHLQMASSGSSSLTYINNLAGTVNMSTAPDGSRMASANFVWNANGGGDAFAWANLQNGDNVAFRFLRPEGGTGLLDSSTFQFVTWGPSGWQLVAIPNPDSLFDADGEYDFSGRVVPLPSVVSMGALPLLAGLAIRRRRATA